MNNNLVLRDYGDNPFSLNIDMATRQNQNFRTVLWTGKHLQLVLMKIPKGEAIGGEVHPHTDQFIKVVSGNALVLMGKNADDISYKKQIGEGGAVVIPAGWYHNIKNVGNKNLRLYTIYAPPEHPFGTVHQTKAQAEKDEKHHHHKNNMR
ncbi:MAG: cupin domain-containing protein [Oscillospiraceae bacterium]|nr:cupin domain-containing protein [Oscillospiraceae bacterium]